MGLTYRGVLMSRLDKLQQNLNHKLVENTDFILRRRFKKEDDLPLKTDCINLSIQYVALYKAIELRLNEIINEKTLYLSIFNKEPWTDRSEQLKNDIHEMRSFLSDTEKKYLIKSDVIFPAMKKMVDKIAQAGPITLFAYLSVRCLEDAFNGQELNADNQRVFSAGKLKGEFYSGVTKQKDILGQFYNQAILTDTEEQIFDEAVDDFLQLHIDLFGEMEERRFPTEPEETPVQSLNYKSCCRYAMFALSTIGLAAAAVGTVYCSLASPQD